MAATRLSAILVDRPDVVPPAKKELQSPRFPSQNVKSTSPQA